MAPFDVRSKVIEVHSKEGGAPFYVHEAFLRQPSGPYDAAIDYALKITGQAALQLRLSHGALAEWTKWLYGTPMGDEEQVEYLEPLLELYEYSCHQFLPEVDHKCANACLDAIRIILGEEFDVFPDDLLFGFNNVPTLVDLVTRLQGCNSKGPQMVVELMAHGSRTTKNVHKWILNIEPVPGLASFFHHLSYAMACECANEAKARFNGGPGDYIPLPNPRDPHRYHSHKAGETLCCGRDTDDDVTEDGETEDDE